MLYFINDGFICFIDLNRNSSFLELNDLAAISSYLGLNRRSLTSVITEALALQRQINHF